MKRLLFLTLILLAPASCSDNNPEPVDTAFLSGVSQYVRYKPHKGDFRLADKGQTATICVSPSDWQGVARAAGDLGDDVRKVTGTASPLVLSDSPAEACVLVGTIGKSPLIDSLVSAGKLDVAGIEGQWESFVIETVDDCLVVAGSDKRGTIYGIYDISEKIGVSPWYWWADVPARRSDAIYIAEGRYVQPSPKVKYRGIFINDEWPSFGGWATRKFGGLNADMHAHLFELLLRLKANYFWPAMWDTAFNEDDPRNPVLADMYGIVMGTSHHEPMMRAHKEYTRRRDDVGPWDYSTNKRRIDRFFTEGMERNKNFENMVTIGMRGDGDVAMGSGNDEENMRVLRDVVKGQREILARVYEKDASQVPQLWAIFTEVQRYYDRGFTVPDDVLLLFCDNNWGYIRRAGPTREQDRSGGLGLYYHIDMNGGPWNDRWVTTTTVPKLREQLNLAYRTGIDDLWIINVGDLKPKELPIDFIMRFAWDPDAIPASSAAAYTLRWAARNFGDEYAEEVASIVSRYSKYNLWRKAEAQVPGIYSVVNYREADRVDELWKKVEEDAEALRARIPAELDDAYYQLVYYPAVASSGISHIYTALTRNRLYAAQGRPLANHYADVAEELFERDLRLSAYYNDTLAGGKWKNMMSDIHIGYEHWYMPSEAVLPHFERVEPLEGAFLGVSAEGCEQADDSLALPVFDALLDQTCYIDLFNRGTEELRYTASADASWVRLSSKSGTLKDEARIDVSIDWNALTDGEHSCTVLVGGAGKTVPVRVKAVKHAMPVADGPYYGNFSASEFRVPAVDFAANVPGTGASWTVLPDLGRGDGCMGIEPVTAPSASPIDAPRLEYRVYLPKSGNLPLCIGILPTQDVRPERGLRLAISIDDMPVQELDARQGLWDEFKEYTPENIASTGLLPRPERDPGVHLSGVGKVRRTEVFDNQRWLTATLPVDRPGMHTVKIYMIDPEVVLEQLVFYPDNSHPSYFAAPPVRHE